MNDRVKILRRPLRNITCPYCGIAIDGTNSTKEHVVGRRFVPKGTLDKSINVILRACHRCNNRKSDLEDDLSTLTMYPDLVRGFEGMGDLVPIEAKRKLEKSYSRTKTRTRVADASEKHTVNSTPLPGLTMSMSFTSPPQMDEARVNELAHYQIRGFFYALTYDLETRLGGFWPDGGFFPVLASRRTDWGNPINVWFMNIVETWYERVVGHIANEHFRVAIRREPDFELWSFALEWNRSTRVIGFFGRQDRASEVAKEIPNLPMLPIGTAPDGGVLSMREEIPLSEIDDRLFTACELSPHT